MHSQTKYKASVVSVMTNTKAYEEQTFLCQEQLLRSVLFCVADHQQIVKNITLYMLKLRGIQCSCRSECMAKTSYRTTTSEYHPRPVCAYAKSVTDIKSEICFHFHVLPDLYYLIWQIDTGFGSSASATQSENWSQQHLPGLIDSTWYVEGRSMDC